MEKLKKAKVTIHVCPTCKGNGYLKVATDGKDTVHQCWDCESEVEFYVYTPETIKPDHYVDPITGDVNKLH